MSVEQLRGTDPRRVGPYELVGVLGSGGMGRVYLGRTVMGVTAAVKVIHADLARDPEFRARFRREVAATLAVTGPRIASVLDADTEAERPWLATEYVPGPSLAGAVAAAGPLTPEAAIELAAGVGDALVAIHAVGLVHRDVKPSNVLLAANGPRLIDFGIARGAADSRLTRTGVALGTPQFMAPEQIQGDREIGPPADVFALGGVLVHALTGGYPFGEGSAVNLLYRIVHEAPRLDRVRPDLRPLTAACLEKDPGARPSAVEAADELRRLSGDPDRTVEVAAGAGAAAGAEPRRGGGRSGAEQLTHAGGRATSPMSVVPAPPGGPGTGGTVAPGATTSGRRAEPGTGERNRRLPIIIGVGAAAAVAAVVLAMSLGSGDGGGDSGVRAGGKAANAIPGATVGPGEVLPPGDAIGPSGSQGAGTPGRSEATSGKPAGGPANATSSGGPAGPTAGAASPGSVSSPSAGAPRTSAPGGGPTAHNPTTAPTPTGGPTSAPATSPGSGTPTRVSSDSSARILQSAYDSHCVNAAKDSSGAKWYTTGSCSGTSAQWRVWRGTPTQAQYLTWQFESSAYPGWCMSTAFTSSGANWSLVPCSQGDAYQWWASSRQPDGATILDSWNDFHYCLVNHSGGIAPEDCSGNPAGLSDNAFWWALK